MNKMFLKIFFFILILFKNRKFNLIQILLKIIINKFKNMNNTIIINKNNLIINNILFKMNLKINQIKF